MISITDATVWIFQSRFGIRKQNVLVRKSDNRSLKNRFSLLPNKIQD